MKAKSDSRKSIKQQFWLSIVIGFSIFVFLVLDSFFHIPWKYVLPALIIGFWIWGAVIIWQRANAKSKAATWWKDDSCSGWRGY